LSDLFFLRTGAYRHALDNPRAVLWASCFLLATGLLYGLSVALFQRTLDGDIKGVPVAQIPDRILFAGNLISGVLIVLVFHGGVTLVVWLMARAVGGPGRLAELYRATAYVLPLSWPGLPSLALHGAAQGASVSHLPLFELYALMAVLAFALACCGLYQLLRETQDVGPGRAASGVFLVAVFCYSVMLLTGR
jgi:hypothetical protein